MLLCDCWIVWKKDEAIYEIVGLPPEALDTIQNIADSINNDQTFIILKHLNQQANSTVVFTKGQTYAQSEN